MYLILKCPSATSPTPLFGCWTIMLDNHRWCVYNIDHPDSFCTLLFCHKCIIHVHHPCYMLLCSHSVLLIIIIIIRRFGRCHRIGCGICFKTDVDAELCMPLLAPVTRDQCPDSMTEFACPGGADHDRSLGAMSVLSEFGWYMQLLWM